MEEYVFSKDTVHGGISFKYVWEGGVYSSLEEYVHTMIVIVVWTNICMGVKMLLT